MHLGHQAVISTSAEHARSVNGTPVVVTFDPHPEKVLRPQAAPHLLTATQHKIGLIRDLGVGDVAELEPHATPVILRREACPERSRRDAEGPVASSRIARNNGSFGVHA